MTSSFFVDTNIDFVDAIKRVENNIALAKKRGEYKKGDDENWRWFPGKSPEGGLPTLAWGHKITPKEWESKRISYYDPRTNNLESKDFRFGCSDEIAHLILMTDLREAEQDASEDWDKYQPKLPWKDLPGKYKGVLVNLTFNTGSLVKNGKWIWNSVVNGIRNNDDVQVVLGMVTSYKRPDGVRVKLKERAIEIAKGLKLPWQILLKN